MITESAIKRTSFVKFCTDWGSRPSAVYRAAPEITREISFPSRLHLFVFYFMSEISFFADYWSEAVRLNMTFLFESRFKIPQL